MLCRLALALTIGGIIGFALAKHITAEPDWDEDTLSLDDVVADLVLMGELGGRDRTMILQVEIENYDG